MRSATVIAALIIGLAPFRVCACDVAIRDTKSAIGKIKQIFYPYRERCHYEGEGIECFIKERNLWSSSMAMPGYVPGDFAMLAFSASEEDDKVKLSNILVDHFLDRSAGSSLVPLMLRAIKGGEELNQFGLACTIMVRLKNGTLDALVAGLMAR